VVCVAGEGLRCVVCEQGKDARRSFCGGIAPLISERALRTPARPLIQIMEVNITARGNGVGCCRCAAALERSLNWIFDSCSCVRERPLMEFSLNSRVTTNND
jgi:hypothetical protein